jgi:hypothetical protein
MRLPVKFKAESLGSASTSTGGSESLGPPPGGIILAQPVVAKTTVALTSKINQLKYIEEAFFIIIFDFANLASIICSTAVFK